MTKQPPPATLRDWRLARGLTQKQAAAVFGCAQSSWANYEQGRRRPRRDLARRLIDHTAVPAEVILGLAS
jgi:transcriptional regulator with XRE-family HTH domain